MWWKSGAISAAWRVRMSWREYSLVRRYSHSYCVIYKWLLSPKTIKGNRSSLKSLAFSNERSWSVQNYRSLCIRSICTAPELWIRTYLFGLQKEKRKKKYKKRKGKGKVKKRNYGNNLWEQRFFRDWYFLYE